MDQHEINPAPNLPKNRIIDMIRKLRNDLIKDFLDERHLLEFLADKYHHRDLSGDNLALIKSEIAGTVNKPGRSATLRATHTTNSPNWISIHHRKK